MVELTLDNFALKQLRVAELCQTQRVSEADTIEKLIVPVFKRIYARPLYFERASRSTKGTRKWDLEVYDHCPLMRKNPNKLLALVECKNMRTSLHTNTGINGAIYLNNFDFKGERNVIDYMTSHSSAQGDDWLQVWMYANNPDFTHGIASSKTILTNGIKWLIFREKFFLGGKNPPNDITIPHKRISCSTQYFLQIVFPKISCENSNDKQIATAQLKWIQSFSELEKALK